MIEKINKNKLGVIEYAIDSEEDLLKLPKSDTDNTVYAIMKKDGQDLVYLYSKKLKDYVLVNDDVALKKRILFEEQVETVIGQVANEVLIFDSNNVNILKPMIKRKVDKNWNGKYYGALNIQFDGLTDFLNKFKTFNYYKVVINNGVFECVYFYDYGWYYIDYKERFIYYNPNDLTVGIYPKSEFVKNLEMDDYIRKDDSLTVKISNNFETKEEAEMFNFEDIKIYLLEFNSPLVTIRSTSVDTNAGNTDDFIEMYNLLNNTNYALDLDFEIDVHCEGVDFETSDRQGTGHIINAVDDIDAFVDYGDGTFEHVTNTKKIQHKYVGGHYRIRIYSKNQIKLINVNKYDGGFLTPYIGQVLKTTINKMDLSYLENGTMLFGDTCNLILNCNLNLSNKLKKMGYMFSTVYEMTNLDFVNFENVNDFDNAFSGMTSLASFPNINTSKVTNFRYAFQQTISLKTIANLDTSACTDATGMFYNAGVESLPILNFASCSVLEYTFESAYSLKEVHLINTNLVNNYYGCFEDAVSLQKVDMLDLTSITDTNKLEYIFDNCVSLKYVGVKGSSSSAIIDALINELPERPINATDNIIDISGCDNKEGVTATKQGWIINKEALENA